MQEKKFPIFCIVMSRLKEWSRDERIQFGKHTAANYEAKEIKRKHGEKKLDQKLSEKCISR